MFRTALVAALILAPALALGAASGKGSRLAEQFKRADADGNGVLSRAEAERGMPRFARNFDAIDTNRDGDLAPEEIRAWLKAQRSRAKANTRSRFEEHFARADADGDGALSRAEAESAMPRIAAKFDRIDADRDGRLTREEMRAWFEARRAARARKS